MVVDLDLQATPEERVVVERAAKAVMVAQAASPEAGVMAAAWEDPPDREERAKAVRQFLPADHQVVGG